MGLVIARFLPQLVNTFSRAFVLHFRTDLSTSLQTEELANLSQANDPSKSPYLEVGTSLRLVHQRLRQLGGARFGLLHERRDAAAAGKRAHVFDA